MAEMLQGLGKKSREAFWVYPPYCVQHSVVLFERRVKNIHKKF